MSSVDYDARQKAFKGLTVITIVLTVLANLCLLYKVVRAAGGVAKVLRGPRGPRYQTFISLIIGDILVAFFSLVVQAKTLFDATNSLTCRTTILANTYLLYIMPFVYGIGLIVLVVECIHFRQRLRSVSHSTSSNTSTMIVSVVVGAVPWLWGLILALPLNIAGIDFSTCEADFTLDRLRANVCVCLIAPAVLSAGLAFLNLLMSPPVAVSQQARVVTQSRTNIMFSPPVPPTAPPSEQLLTHEDVHGDFPKQHPGLTNDPPGAVANHQPQNNYHPYGQEPPQYSQPVTQAPYLPPGTVTYTPAGQTSMVQPPPDLSIYYSESEKGVLVVVAFCFCMCVLPYAVFALAYRLNTDRTPLEALTEVVINDTTFWALATRSFVLPICLALGMWAQNISVVRHSAS